MAANIYSNTKLIGNQSTPNTPPSATGGGGQTSGGGAGRQTSTTGNTTTSATTPKANPSTGVTDTGGSGSSAGRDYSGEMRSMYEAQLAAEREAARRKAEALAASIEATRPELQQKYDDAARQAYINKEIANRNLGQQYAATGLSGGMSESARLGLETNYGNQLTSLDNELSAGNRALDAEIARARLGELDANSNISAGYLSALSQMMINDQNYQNQRAMAEYQNQLSRQNAAYTAANSGVTTRGDQEETDPTKTGVATYTDVAGDVGTGANTQSNAYNPYDPQGGANEAIQNIRQAYNDGSISFAQAQKLARQYGVTFTA